MHQGLKTLFIGSVLLAGAPAFAQGDDAAATAGGTATVGAGADANANAGAAGAAGTAPAGVSASTTPMAWPQEMGDRPYTITKGGIAAFGDLDILHASPGGMGGGTQEQLHIGGAYGINDQLTVGAEFSFPFAGDGTDQTGFKGPLRFFGMYGISHTDKLTIAAEAHFELNLCGGVSITATSADCASTKAIGAGLDARYKVNPKVQIFTGSPFGPGVPGATGGVVFPGLGTAGVGQHLNVSLESSGPITFEIPVGVGIQATPQVFAYAETVLAGIYLANAPMGADSVSVIGSDSLGIPVQLAGFYAVNKNLDAGITFLDDLKHAGDLYVFGLAARWYK